jgi:hypothetical protein
MKEERNEQQIRGEEKKRREREPTKRTISNTSMVAKEWQLVFKGAHFCTHSIGSITANQIQVPHCCY